MVKDENDKYSDYSEMEHTFNQIADELLHQAKNIKDIQRRNEKLIDELIKAIIQIS